MASMTTTPFPGSDEFNQVRQHASISDEVIGTHHLLLSMVLRSPRIKELLDACDVTLMVVVEMVKRRDEASEPGAVGRLLSDSVKPVQFSSAAAAALDRAQAQPSVSGENAAERSPADVLLAVLGDSRNRASGILTECGVDLEQVRAALCEGTIPARVDPLPADLRRTRDALLARTRYRAQGRGIGVRLRNLLLGYAFVNYIAQPVLWVRLEADELARQDGHRMRTDDVLLALLTTHEVALAYPHLMRPEAQPKDNAGPALLAAGLDRDRIAAARASDELGADAVPLPGPIRDWPQDTGQILRRLLCAEGTRSARLLAKLQAPKDVLCWKD
jgi:hypothetical protein